MPARSDAFAPPGPHAAPHVAVVEGAQAEPTAAVPRQSTAPAGPVAGPVAGPPDPGGPGSGPPGRRAGGHA